MILIKLDEARCWVVSQCFSAHLTARIQFGRDLSLSHGSKHAPNLDSNLGSMRGRGENRKLMFENRGTRSSTIQQTRNAICLLRVNRYRSLERLAAEITPSFMRLNFPPSHSFWALFFVYLISTYRDPRASILLVTSTHLRR